MIENLVREIIKEIGDDPTREGVLETPKRVAKAYGEWFRGYKPFSDPITTFKSDYRGILKRKSIPFQSFCEHHMAPYTGTIDFGYIPNGAVIGLSKIPRIFRHYAAKLSIQENLTLELMDRFYELFPIENIPTGAIIVVRAKHTCESSRGVRIEADTITSEVRGEFAQNLLPREEFLSL